MMVREKAGRPADPSLVVLDSQSVRAAAGVPKSTRGLDAAKKTPGRRRGLAVDVIGLIIAVVVVAASVHDNAIGAALLDKVAGSGYSRVSKALVDQGFKASVVEHGAKLGIDQDQIIASFAVHVRRSVVTRALTGATRLPVRSVEMLEAGPQLGPGLARILAEVERYAAVEFVVAQAVRKGVLPDLGELRAHLL